MSDDSKHYGDVRAYVAAKDYDNAVMAAYRITHPDLRHIALKQAYALIGAIVADF